MGEGTEGTTVWLSDDVLRRIEAGEPVALVPEGMSDRTDRRRYRLVLDESAGALDPVLWQPKLGDRVLIDGTGLRYEFTWIVTDVSRPESVGLASTNCGGSLWRSMDRLSPDTRPLDGLDTTWLDAMRAALCADASAAISTPLADRGQA